MSKLFVMLKRAWHFLPPPLRNTGPLHRLAFRVMEKTGDRSDIYSPKYYQTLVEPYAQRSVPHMAKSMVETFRPQSAIDIGCAEAGLDIARARGLDAHRFNLAADRWTGSERFDIAVSMETAEHLPASAAERYVELLCSLAPVVIFTAAPPGQGGIGHLNEQPREYWTELFKTHGFQSLETAMAAWQPVWRVSGVADFYTRNLMVFQRRVSPARPPRDASRDLR
jgi:hypothetical protein